MPPGWLKGQLRPCNVAVAFRIEACSQIRMARNQNTMEAGGTESGLHGNMGVSENRGTLVWGVPFGDSLRFGVLTGSPYFGKMPKSVSGSSTPGGVCQDSVHAAGTSSHPLHGPRRVGVQHLRREEAVCSGAGALA